tara:strand:- start:52 stop:639 length:588 start_codon:yes stop_codon:yes gene_type:complete
MALRPVGAGGSLAISGTAVTSSAFDVQSNVIRLTAVDAGCHVIVKSGVAETVGETDTYIPANTSLSLAQTKGSNIVDSITAANPCVVYAPEGTQWPFVIGDCVGLTTGSCDSNWTSKISYAEVTAVWNGNAGPYNSDFKAKLTLGNVNTSGISTAYTTNLGQSIVRQHKVSVVNEKGNANKGSLYYQQVQISGDG